MKFLNKEYLIFSDSKEYSQIVEDKLTELGVRKKNFFNTEESFLDAYNSDSYEYVIILVTQLEDSAQSIIGSMEKYEKQPRVTLLTTKKNFELKDYQIIYFNDFIKIQKEPEALEYLSIDFNKQLIDGTSPCDIYIKINEEKYLKLINKDEDISSIDFSKYMTDSEENLFVLKSDANTYYNFVFNKMVKLSNLTLSLEDFRLVSKLIEAIVPLSVALKISPKLVEDLVNIHLDVYKETRSFLDLNTVTDKDDGMSRKLTHLMLSTLLSKKILKNIEWGSNTVLKKIIKCSLFHNLSIGDDHLEYEELAKIKDHTLLRKNFLLHPLKSASIVEKFDFVDNDIVTMINQHHEQGDGSGFPKGLTNSTISKMSSVFIISEYLTNEILMVERKEVGLLVQLIRDIPQYHREGKFREVYESLCIEYKKYL